MEHSLALNSCDGDTYESDSGIGQDRGPHNLTYLPLPAKLQFWAELLSASESSISFNASNEPTKASSEIYRRMDDSINWIEDYRELMSVAQVKARLGISLHNFHSKPFHTDTNVIQTLFISFVPNSLS